jgi:hypothetical protein
MMFQPGTRKICKQMKQQARNQKGKIVGKNLDTGDFLSALMPKGGRGDKKGKSRSEHEEEKEEEKG